MGGGRRNFLKKGPGSPGYRIDNRDLIEEWKQKMQAQNKKHTYVTNLTDFRALKPNQYDHMLGTYQIIGSNFFNFFLSIDYVRHLTVLKFTKNTKN